jgi:glycosyltransferase involved in cell wall biosynthesis
MLRVLVVSNIPTPYQMDFLDELSQHCVLKAAFLWSREANRDWTLSAHPWLTIIEHEDDTTSKKSFQALLDALKPDVIIVGGYRLPLANWLRRYAATHGARYFYWLEKPLPASGWRRLARKIIWATTLPFAHGVLGIGSEAVAAYAPYARSIFTLPYSINAARYAGRGGHTPTFPLRFFFVGQFITRKGIAELLEAFSTLPPDKATLALAGSGEQKALVDAATAKHPHITLMGFMEPAALAAEFSRHDVFILPSRHDGWAVVVAEAMAAGLPVISTMHTGAFVDLVAPHDCGHACEVSAASIRQAVQYYIDNPDEVPRQGARGIAVLAQSRATATRAVDDLLTMLGAHAPAH